LAEPRISDPVTGLPDQPKDATFGKSLPPTKLGCGRTCRVLSHQALYGLCLKPLTNATFSAMTIGAPLWATAWASYHVRQQCRVQFESPQADTPSLERTRVCRFEPGYSRSHTSDMTENGRLRAGSGSRRRTCRHRSLGASRGATGTAAKYSTMQRNTDAEPALNRLWENIQSRHSVVSLFISAGYSKSFRRIWGPQTGVILKASPCGCVCSSSWASRADSKKSGQPSPDLGRHCPPLPRAASPPGQERR
jgi:hypothetical protein